MSAGVRPTALEHVELDIAGMTCASCAPRIEKKPNRLDGVDGRVNYATEKASLTVPSEYDRQVLIAAVDKAGYTAALPRHPGEDAPAAGSTDDAELRSLRIRLIAAIAPVAGALLTDCSAARPTSVLQIHGTADDRVPYAGGPGKAFAVNGNPRVDGPSVGSVNAT